MTGRMRRVVIAISVAAALPLAVMIIDAARGRGPFDEGAPILDAGAVLRSLALIVAVVALLIAVDRLAVTRTTTAWPPWARPAIFVTLLLTIAATVLVIVDPLDYHLAAEEDGLLENITALWFAVGAVAVLMVSLRGRAGRGLPRWVGVAMGAGFLLSAGEEISWGQRIFGFSSPGVLAEANLQQEANLHNLATDPVEAAFYAGCALLFVLIPFAVARTGLSPRFRSLAPLVPAAWIAVVAAPSAAMNLDMWDVIPVQLTVWASLGVLVVIAIDRRKSGDGAWRLVVATIGVTVIVQVVSLLTTDTVIELHDVTEYKEFALGLVAAMYGLDLLARTRASADSPTS